MRLPLNDFFMGIANLVSSRSTCCKRQVGAVAVRDKRILSTGYNGAPRGVEHCTPDTCLRKDIPSGEQLERCMATHAEANVVANAAYEGVSLKGATLYCTTKPCLSCCKLLINAGIKTVYYLHDYPSEITDKLAADGYIEMVCMDTNKNDRPTEDKIQTSLDSFDTYPLHTVSRCS
jgi:dCMP deaminase